MNPYEAYSHGDAEGYSAARPEYPDGLFDRLLGRCHGRNLAWDCGTGSRQAAARLAPRFRTVVATDASRAQLGSRRRGANLHYALARAERPPLADGSADLVTVAQALHWLDLPAFFAEARRALRPGGLLAAWCFFLPEVNPPVDAAVRRLYEEILGGYMPPQIGLVIDRYRAISPPFGEVARTEVGMVERWDLGRFARYLMTWAAVALCRERTGRDPLGEVMPELARGWGGPDAVREVRWTISLLEARK